MTKSFNKLIIATVCLLGLSSCTPLRHMRKVSKISAKRAMEECQEPVQFYAVPPVSYGVDVRLMRHEKCMEIPDLVMSVWIGEDNEISETTAKLLALLFIQSLNVNSDLQRGHIFLKKDTASEQNIHILFYELVEINPKDYKNKNDNHN